MNFEEKKAANLGDIFFMIKFFYYSKHPIEKYFFFDLLIVGH